MKTPILKNLTGNIPAILAVSCFVIFSSVRKDNPAPAAPQCNTGYSMSTINLRQFMLDSLNGTQFPGGVYSKADLLFAINSLSSLDDSVHLVNIFVNCTEAFGTDLALTSPHTSKVKYARVRKECKCNPPRPCCRNSACVPKINFGCFNFQPYTPSALSNDKVNAYSLQQDN